jgi:capsular polysaccharide biosynthesis protein
MESASLPRTLQRHQTTAWVTFVFIATMTLLGAFLPQERYEATSTVAVQPAREDVTTRLLDYLIPSLQAMVSGSALGAAVDQMLPPPARNVNREVSTVVPAGSGVMSITVVSDDRQASVTTANAYARFLATRNLGTPALRVLVIDSATKAKQTTSRSTLILSGLALGMILAPLVALLSGSWDLPDEDDMDDDDAHRVSASIPGGAPGDTHGDIPARSAPAGPLGLGQRDPAQAGIRGPLTP